MKGMSIEHTDFYNAGCMLNFEYWAERKKTKVWRNISKLGSGTIQTSSVFRPFHCLGHFTV